MTCALCARASETLRAFERTPRRCLARHRARHPRSFTRPLPAPHPSLILRLERCQERARAPARPSPPRCERGRTHPRTSCVLPRLERSGSQVTSHLILTSHRTLCPDKAASRAIRWSGNLQGVTCSRFHGTIRRNCANRSNHQGWWPLSAPTRLLCFDRDRATNRRRSFISKTLNELALRLGTASRPNGPQGPVELNHRPVAPRRPMSRP